MPAASRPAVLRRLLQYCATNFLRDRSSFCNFTYLLREIHARHEFFHAIQASDPEVIDGLCKVAKQYVVSNEIERALETLGEALEHATAASQPVRDAIEQMLIATVARLDLLAVDPSAWILTVLPRLSTDSRRRLLEGVLGTLRAHTARASGASVADRLSIVAPVRAITIALFVRPDATEAHKRSGRGLLQRLYTCCHGALAYMNTQIASYGSTVAGIRSTIASHQGRQSAKQAKALKNLGSGIASYESLSRHYELELRRLQPWVDVVVADGSLAVAPSRRRPSVNSYRARSRPY